MAEDWVGGKFFRDGMNMWRDSLPMAGSYTRGMGQLADAFGFTPSAMLREVVSTARRQLIGKPVEFDVGTNTVSLVLEDLRVDSTSMGPALGQLLPHVYQLIEQNYPVRTEPRERHQVVRRKENDD